MTISTEAAALSYDGDGSTVTFSITWKYFDKSHVVATLRDANGAETTWTRPSDYDLTVAGVDAGGTLTATTAPASGETLVITLEPPNTQTQSLTLGGSFPSTTVEDGLDIAAQRDSKQSDLMDRMLRVPKTDTQSGSSLELPIDSSRASKFLSFDGNGAPTAAAGTSADLTPVSAYINGLLDDGDADAAKTTLNALGTTEDELTIASGSVTPTGTAHSIDTESDAATDNLDNILTTNLAAGSLLLIRGENAARVVTVRDTQGGAGQVHTATGDDVTLLGTTNYMLLQRRGADWYETQLGASLGQGQGADIASASALAVVVPGAMHDVTGTTTITSFNSAGIGTVKVLQFDGALTLTHHATDLILPGGANITTTAGDIGVFYEYAAGDWRCVSYSRGGGVPAAYRRETPQATTSGTEFDFTSLPSWVNRMQVLFDENSLTGTDDILVQLGDSGGFEVTGYISTSNDLNQAGGSAGASSTSGFVVDVANASLNVTGIMEIVRIGSNDWVASHQGKRSTTSVVMGAGSKTLSGTLTQVRVTRTGTDTFDGGQVGLVLYG